MSNINFCLLKRYGSVNLIQTQLAHGEIVCDRPVSNSIFSFRLPENHTVTER